MKYLIGFLLSLLILSVGFWLGISSKDGIFNNNITNIFTSISDKDHLRLDMYSIENLSQTEIKPGTFEILEKTQDKEKFSSYIFKFTFNPSPTENYEKYTTGIINIPKDIDKPNIILMIRGYVDQELFSSGMGTRSSSEYFSENGFITIAPDFLGYGNSSEEAENIFETRFQTYTTVLSLIESLINIKNNPNTISDSLDNFAKNMQRYENLFIWAHSNGGQIALTTLAITGKNYPTVLWAPVTKPFPYSILYYTDEAEDGGKFLRSELSKLEKYNDSKIFSFTNYIDRINAPIQLYQGTADDAVPLEWSQSFINTLNQSYKERGLQISGEFIIKNGADHNLIPLWDESIHESIKFYKSFFID